MVVIGCILLLAVSPLAMLYTFVGIWKNPSNWRKFFPFYIITFFIIAYTYNPLGNGVDLVRYLQQIEDCGKLSFRDALAYYNDGLFVRTTAFWIAGKLGVPHLIPGTSFAIVYGVMFYISCTTAERYGVQKLIPIVLLAELMILPYSSLINNVRNVSAFSLVTLAAYKDIIYKKRNFWVLLLYILPCFIHHSAIVFVVFRVVALIVGRPRVYIYSLIFLLPLFVNIAYQNRAVFASLGNIGQVLTTLIGKAYGSFDSEFGAYELNVMRSQFWPVHRFIMVTCSVWVSFIILTYRQYANLEEQHFSAFITANIMTTLACALFSVIPTYWRFFSAMMVAAPTVVIPFIAKRHIIVSKFKSVLLTVFPVFMSSRILLEIWYSRSSTNYLDWLFMFIRTNIISVVVNIFQTLHH